MLVFEKRIGDVYPVVSTEQANAIAQVEIMESSQARQGIDPLSPLSPLFQQVESNQFVLGDMLTLFKLGRTIHDAAFFFLLSRPEYG
ncbi:hypothetical protein, partial [Aeromonas veronii]|uniref:hypothetical protein n=1 Tax=Aeromonas veronii TaxID=654 RepID=UPI0005A9365B